MTQPEARAGGVDDVIDLGTILGVWAHPDDEAYLSAGLMALAVGQGQRVVVVTATRGELGSLDEARWPSARMSAIREGELMRSLEILGVSEHHWLGYPDGGLAELDPEEGIARVQAIIEEVRPATVVTFGPDGITGHPDHRTIHRWTTAAFRRAGLGDARLLYTTFSPEWVQRFAQTLQRFDVFSPGTPAPTPVEDIALQVVLPPGILELKIRALLAHESQVEGLHAALGGDFVRAWQGVEYFRAADV